MAQAANVRKILAKISLQNSRVAGALGVVLVFLVGFWLLSGNVKLGRSLTLNSYVSYYDLELTSPPNVQTSAVVMVYIDEQSHKDLDQPFNKPWDRAVHAAMLGKLKAAGAKAVMLDIIFSDPGPDPIADLALAKAFQSQSNVVLAADRSYANHVTPGNERYEFLTLTKPYKNFLDAAAGWGLDQLSPDEDFVVRRHFHGEGERDSEWSMTWKMATLVGMEAARDPAQRSAERWVRYYGRPETIPNVSYSQVMYSDGLKKDFFKDKIVIVGARPITGAFNEKRDELRSPYSMDGRLYLFMPNVEVHATILLNLLHKDWLVRPPPKVEIAVLFALALIFGYGLCRCKPVFATLLAFLGAVLTIFLALLLFTLKNIWFPWLIVVVVQIPVALLWSILIRSLDWYVQRKKFEAERQVAEARIREQAALLDKAQDAIFVISLDWHVQYWNRSSEALFGWSEEEMLKAGREASFLGLQNPSINQAREAAFEHHEWHGEIQLVNKAGQPMTVESRWTLVRDADGISNSFLVINTDITEKKKAQVRIQEQAALLDKAQDAIFVQNLEGKTTYLNQSAAKLYGWTSEEILNQDAFGKVLPPRDANILEARTTVIQKGEWTGELTQKNKAGVELIVESRWTLVRDDSGQPNSILVINTDITERKKLESQFLRTQRMESIGTLAGGIAHDLNNVLAPILLGVELLERKLPDEASQKMLGTIATSARRGRDMVKQVLTFARGNDGEKSILQLSHLIKEMDKIVRETFPKNVQTHINLGEALSPILGDATQLHQILLNLCVNARDAMPDGGEIFISATNVTLTEADAAKLHGAKPIDYVVLSVRDTGTGIPPEILDKIFEPFFTTKEIGKGTGLGLSTVISIIKSHNGVLDLKSTVGEGTTFSVYLPAEKTAAVAEARKIDPASIQGRGELVLVVDDEPAIREMVKASLDANGFRVITANNGAEAIEVCSRSEEEISVVLMDMMMPVMGGSTAMRMLRRQKPKLKIIGMSGLMQNEKFQEQFAGKNIDFLAKPFSGDKLLETLRKTVDTQPNTQN